MDPDQPGQITLVNRATTAVLDAVVATLEDADDLQVVEVDRPGRQARFATRSDPPTATWVFEVEVGHDEVSGLTVSLLRPAASSLTDHEVRKARAIAERFTDDVRSTLDHTPPTAAEQDLLADQPGAGKEPLARLTRRRAPLAALVLLVAYAVPLLLVWLVGRAAAAGLLGDAGWVPVTLSLVLGLGLFAVLTAKLGAWVQLVSFGEEYMVTFQPVAGFFLGWWRFAVQLGAFILVAVLTAHADEQATLEQMTSAETTALPALAARAPVPATWEQISSSTRQSEYVGRPNAVSEVSYGAPGTLEVSDLEAFLADPGWAAPTDGGRAIGALRDITCDAEHERCQAEVTPPAGEPAEYGVEVRINDVFSVRMDDGSPGTYVQLEVSYEQDASRADDDG